MPLLPLNNFFSTSSSNRRYLNLNFESSFRPIIFIFRLYGVDVGSIKTPIGRWITHFYALFCLALNVGINIQTRLVFKLSFVIVGESNITSAYKLLGDVIFLVGYIGNHLILLFFVRPRFTTEVMQSFRLVENQLNDERLFTKIQRFSTVCIVITLFLVWIIYICLL